MSVLDTVPDHRSTRLLSFLGVGGVGMIVDLAITIPLLGVTSPLAANAAGFAVAVSHNFAGNWWLTYDRPDGRLARQYGEYVAAHLLTFGLRAVVLSAVLAATALPATVATLVGIAAAAVVNFLATERIFDAGGDSLNRVAHRVYNSRLRGLLLTTGLYHVVFGAYGRVLNRVTDDRQVVSVGAASATFGTERPTETVSILHTIENEGEVLERFVADVQPGDRVLDVGANLGVFSGLAASVGADVTAVEAHPPTAEQCRRNCPTVDVATLALGDSVGSVAIETDRDAVGTQRGTVGGEGSVAQLPGDRLQRPDVVKIDVEGAEVAVLDGLRRTLDEEPPRVIYVETHGDDRRQAVRERLEASGYAVEEIGVGEDETMLRAVR